MRGSLEYLLKEGGHNINPRLGSKYVKIQRDILIDSPHKPHGHAPSKVAADCCHSGTGKQSLQPSDTELRADDFVAWLLTLRTTVSTQLSFSALNTHSAGLFNLFRVYKEDMSKTLERGLGDHFKGLKRAIAKESATGAGQAMKLGKDPLPFDLYKFLGFSMLCDSSVDLVFARTYMVVAWNLMCRSANAFGILLKHMEWRDDALCIYNDQAGNRPRDPRPVYADPLEPEVCPILALGIYWSVFSFGRFDGKLFPGGSQYDRFRKELVRVLQRFGGAYETSSKPSEIGTRSLRKGAATFASSRLTACPSSTAVNLRAGWSQGCVQNTYLWYESAGDMHVGRTVAGLAPNSHHFSCLPPHFECCDDEVEQAVSVVYPGAPRCVHYILELALASLAYHRTNLPASHCLFCTPLFASESMLTGSSERLKGGKFPGTSKLNATGVPPHVSILSNMASLQHSAEKTLAKIDSSCKAVVNDIMEELERRATGSGTVTYDDLNGMIMRSLDSAGVTYIKHGCFGNVVHPV
ncbi:LOW QUALITY PROTEIN: hypothetical protein PHPALM_30491 [Phytophthora palmivora]|uniref:Uncharacterized protein n=1 Tax=Phytophthora palmivora TaxID=4796 RepID=A0A2P4X4Y4_9STRA|nr:LOW QUALITY PROTEIN: hypothetical protein PHPALM_30491 [Phytophthora palmivora]